MKWKLFFDWINETLKTETELDCKLVQALLYRLYQSRDNSFPILRYRETMAKFSLKLVTQISKTTKKIPFIEKQETEQSDDN